MAPLSVAPFLCGGVMEIRATVSKLFPGGLEVRRPGAVVVRRAQKCFMGPRGGEVEAKPLATSEQSKDVQST